MMRSFLREFIADSSRMRIIAFHFMSRVRRSQRFVSGYVVVRLAQLRLVERVWDQCESRIASGPSGMKLSPPPLSLRCESRIVHDEARARARAAAKARTEAKKAASDGEAKRRALERQGAAAGAQRAGAVGDRAAARASRGSRDVLEPGGAGAAELGIGTKAAKQEALLLEAKMADQNSFWSQVAHKKFEEKASESVKKLPRRVRDDDCRALLGERLRAFRRRVDDEVRAALAEQGAPSRGRS